MKKEEILEANKKENAKKDVYEIEVDNKACKYAAMGMFILAGVLLIYEMAIDKGVNPAFYSFLSLFNAVAYGYKASKLEKNRKANIVVAVLWGIVTVVLLLCYFKVI